MGFRSGSYCTVWSSEPISDTMTKCRVSISRKNRQTGEYEQDFSGFLVFVGTAAAKKAAMLKERDRIRLGDVDVTNRYDREKNVEYTSFKVFSFETQNEMESGSSTTNSSYSPAPVVDDGELDDSDLPF